MDEGAGNWGSAGSSGTGLDGVGLVATAGRRLGGGGGGARGVKGGTVWLAMAFLGQSKAVFTPPPNQFFSSSGPVE